MAGFRTIAKTYILGFDKIADFDTFRRICSRAQACIGANYATRPQPCPLDMRE